MWTLLLLAVSISNPRDMPATVTLDFPDRTSCEQSAATLTYTIKYNGYKVIAQCQKKSSSSQTISETK